MPETFDVWTSTATMVAQGFSPARAGGKPTSSLVFASIARVSRPRQRSTFSRRESGPRPNVENLASRDRVDLAVSPLFEEFLSARGLRGGTRLAATALHVGPTRRRAISAALRPRCGGSAGVCHDGTGASTHGSTTGHRHPPQPRALSRLCSSSSAVGDQDTERDTPHSLRRRVRATPRPGGRRGVAEGVIPTVSLFAASS
jgi:hypothetical protein